MRVYVATMYTVDPSLIRPRVVQIRYDKYIILNGELIHWSNLIDYLLPINFL